MFAQSIAKDGFGFFETPRIVANFFGVLTPECLPVLHKRSRDNVAPEACKFVALKLHIGGNELSFLSLS